MDIYKVRKFGDAVDGNRYPGRGIVLGMEPQVGWTLLHAEAPQAELFSYANDLRAMTQARGTFTLAFDRYEEVPGQLAQKIIEAHKAEEEAEKK